MMAMLFNSTCALLLWFMAASLAHSEPSFEPFLAKSIGFLTLIERTEPFVFLRTKQGIQILNDNGTCFDNLTSIYYNSESEIKYLSSSYYDNFIFFIASQSCVKSLFNSEWNTGIYRDIKGECSQSIHKDDQHHYLSSSRRMIYTLNKAGKVVVTSIKDPNVNAELQFTGKQITFTNVTAFHMTDFEDQSQDRILIGDSTRTKVHVISVGGHYQGSYELHKTDKLHSIASNHEKHYYFAVQRDKNAVVLRVNITSDPFSDPIDSHIDEVFNEINQLVVSISMSNHLMAVLLGDEGDTFRLHINELPGKGSSQKTMFLCEKGGGLYGIHLIDSRDKLLQKYICDAKYKEFPENLCTKPFNRSSIIYEEQLHLNATEVHDELWLKSILTCILTLLCILVLGLFQVMNSAQNSA